MVSAKDVENYKTIKESLDELRLLVEKSELWVYKAKKKSEEKSRKKSSVKDQSKMDGKCLEGFTESVDMQVWKYN